MSDRCEWTPEQVSPTGPKPYDDSERLREALASLAKRLDADTTPIFPVRP